MNARTLKEKKKQGGIKGFKTTWPLYVMFLFPFVWFLIFSYIPMAGISMAFVDFIPGSGIPGFFTGEFVGFANFKRFYDSFFFWQIIRNTIVISLLDIAVNFFTPIILALMFNEIISKVFRRIAQSITYLPKFISMVIIVSIYKEFLSLSDGVINNFIAALGGQRIYFLAEPKYFWIIFTLMNTWATIGWSSIIYLSAISGVNPELYEACRIDGGGRFRMIWNITLPGIRNTIIIMLILRMGTILSVGLEPILLLSNVNLYSTAEVLSLHVYNIGILRFDYSYAAAVGLIQSFIGLIMVIITNFIAKRVADFGLW